MKEPMKTESTPVRLVDYRPPDFAVDSVDLDVRLDPDETAVAARLVLRRTGGDRPLVLQGDELALVSVALDGAPLARSRYEARPDRLTVRDVPSRPFTLEVVTRLDPGANTKLMGLYR
jgi:aminopeptidase N